MTGADGIDSKAHNRSTPTDKLRMDAILSRQALHESAGFVNAIDARQNVHDEEPLVDMVNL